MPSLKDALNRILHWFQENNPTAISSLASALSSLEINAALDSLPFQVPQEVKDLYEWTNGLNEDIFDGMCLLSLESAVEQAKDWAEEPYEEIAAMYRYAGKAIFPICQTEGNFLAVVETDNEQEASPIVALSHAGGIEIVLEYVNLTAMMLTVAESYETDGFIDPKGYIEREEEKYAAAYRNHNSEIGELALKRFLSMIPNDPSYRESVQVLYGDLHLINHQCGIEIPSSPLKTQVVNILFNLLKDEQYDRGFSVILALEELQAVDALVQGLKHPNNWTQSRAAFTLETQSF